MQAMRIPVIHRFIHFEFWQNKFIDILRILPLLQSTITKIGNQEIGQSGNMETMRNIGMQFVV